MLFLVCSLPVTVLGTENAMGLSDELFLGLSVTEMDSWGEGRQTEGVRWHGALLCRRGTRHEQREEVSVHGMAVKDQSAKEEKNLKQTLRTWSRVSTTVQVGGHHFL